MNADAQGLMLNTKARKARRRPNGDYPKNMICRCARLSEALARLEFIRRSEEYWRLKRENDNLCYAIVAKQRNGPTGMLRLNFIGAWQSFTERDD